VVDNGKKNALEGGGGMILILFLMLLCLWGMLLCLWGMLLLRIRLRLGRGLSHGEEDG